jgi:hypothetical protein
VSDFSSTLATGFMVDRQPRLIYWDPPPGVNTPYVQRDISVQKIASLLLTMALILPDILNEHKNLEKIHFFEEKKLFSSFKGP